MRRTERKNGVGLGWGRGLSGLSMFAPSGDEGFLGGVRPQVPLHLRRGGHLGLFEVRPRRGRVSGVVRPGREGPIVRLGGASGVVRPGREGPIVRLGGASGVVHRGRVSGVVRPGREGPIVRPGGVGPNAC
jgi:hypothetical protein